LGAIGPPSEPEPARPPPAAGRGQRPIRRISAERSRLVLAFLLSLLIHALLLSLTFGGQGLGLPGFGFPWRERRIEAPDLRIVLVPAQVAAAQPAGTSVEEPLPQASVEQPAAGGPASTRPVPPAPALGGTAESIAPLARRTARIQPTAEATPEPDAAIGAADAGANLRTDGPVDAAPAAITEPAVIATERSGEATVVVPVAPSLPMPVIAAAPSASSPEAVMVVPRDAGDAAQKRVNPEAPGPEVERAGLDRSELEAQRRAAQREAARIETARQDAAREEAERVENARLEAEREEAARQAAARQGAARQGAARKEAERVESARLDAEREEAARQAARQEAARQEAERQEAVRQEAARQEAARQEVQRIENARLEAERQDAVRQEAARQEAARQEAALEAEARREAARRAMGRQLDEEAARREAASTAARPAFPRSRPAATCRPEPAGSAPACHVSHP